MSGTQEEGEKEATHPCWHMQRLITMAAVSTDVGLRGSCQSVCVFVCKYVHICVCICACDSVWQWSEGYLVMTAADTMGPFLYLSIQCSLSPPSHLSSSSPLPRFCSNPVFLFVPFHISPDCGKMHTCCCLDVCIYMCNIWMSQPIQELFKFIRLIPRMCSPSSPPFFSFRNQTQNEW